MVSTSSQCCAECADFQASDRIDNVGCCGKFNDRALGTDPACNAHIADSLQLAAALTATYDDRLPPHQVTYDGATVQFIRSHPLVWDVSIQAPYRRLLGQIELAPDRGGWLVINVDRIPFSDGAIYASYFEATIALRRLACNPIEWAGKQGRHLRVISAVVGAAIVATALLPLPAWAYRGSGRDVTEPPASQSQTYQPPDNGGPDGTIGAGTR